MNKTIFAALLLLGMSIMFASCDKTGTDGSIKRTLVGCWINETRLREDYGEEWWKHVSSYYEYTKDGFEKDFWLTDKFYDKVFCTFEDGVLVVPDGAEFDFEIYDYAIKDGYMVSQGSSDLGKIEIINKNKFRMCGWDFLRITKFRKK